MKYHGSTLRFASEAIIFLFPLLSESCAFTAAIYVKNSGVENGSGLLILLAAVKLASSLLEYKGFEEAYLANAFGIGSAFPRIGLIQSIQGIVLPSIIILFAQYVLSWSINPLFVSLLMWTGILTSSRQFLSYHWRAQLKKDAPVGRRLFFEITGSYVWLGLLATATLSSQKNGAPLLTMLMALSWKLWFGFVLVLVLFFMRNSGPNLAAGLSPTQWAASIGQAFTSQLSKEFFVMAATTSIATGFIARVVVTIYGVVVAYPVTFYRIRVFDRYLAAQPERAETSKIADYALRKISLLLGAACLIFLPFAGRLFVLTGIDFPFGAALAALGLAHPLAAFDALAYFALIRRGLRSMCSFAAAAGGVFAIIAGLSIARSISNPAILTFSFIAILGSSDFIVNRVSKSLAYR